MAAQTQWTRHQVGPLEGMLVDKGVQANRQGVNIVGPQEQAGHQVIVPAVNKGEDSHRCQARQSQRQNDLVKGFELGNIRRFWPLPPGLWGWSRRTTSPAKMENGRFMAV